MNVLDAITRYLERRKEDKAELEGFCPNCWGKQEYEGKFHDALQKENIDLNNIGQKKGWIQAYATKNFEGIRLKVTDDIEQCPTCKLAYRPN